MQKLYRIEKVLRNQQLSDQEFWFERRVQATPVLEKFKKWMDTKVDQVPPGTGVDPAIHYTLGQWPKLTAYLDSPYLTPDNNGAENAIRSFVLGRKNWLFAGNPKGAASSCGIYSLIETAKQNNIDPFGYLNLVFEKAPLANTERDWESLLPWNISS